MAYQILLSVLVAVSITTCIASNIHQLQIPNQPPAGTQILSGSFQGYSMEMASFADIAGNLSSPNKLSYKMLQNLASISKSPPPIRVGGTTANHAIWAPDQKESIIQNFAVPGADQPANVTWGPSFLESFRVFPSGTGYTVGLTFDSGDEGERRSVEEARAFYDGVGGDLYAFEVGNEFDVFPVDRNETTWSISQYVREWLSRTTTITTSILPRNKSPKIFQAGAFVAPGTLNNDFSWTAPAAINLGITSTAHAKTFCTHQYFGAACRPVKPTLAGNLMNRTALAEYMQYHASASAYTVANGLPYVIGETNSIACQGLAGVSDVFGAAVWSVDYALYAASLNVSRIFWHMGTGYRYAAWQAVRNGTTEPGPRPLYYGNLFVAKALGDGDSMVVSVLNTSSLAGYAVYSTGRRGGRSLKSVVLVNMEVFNSTASLATSRPSARFVLPPQLFKKGKLSVQRLTAAGAEVRDGISFAGQVVEKNGKITGKCRKEGVRDGIVTVSASEAVLISVD